LLPSGPAAVGSPVAGSIAAADGFKIGGSMDGCATVVGAKTLSSGADRFAFDKIHVPAAVNKANNTKKRIAGANESYKLEAGIANGFDVGKIGESMCLLLRVVRCMICGCAGGEWRVFILD
jgi:hypothetical protein